ncbi:hypothetical protein RYX45_22270, partial [Alkalihalophilus pseudofirmus]
GHVASLPLIFDDNYKELISTLVEDNISISTNEWNRYETSWGFKSHPLLHNHVKDMTIELSFENWKKFTSEQFEIIKNNEEEINRIFIKIY